MLRSRFSKFTAVFASLALALMLVPIVPGFTQPAQAANAYPTASEVYVSGQPMSEYTGKHASYDASTGTLTLTNQVMGVSVQSTRSNLDLNIVAEGSHVPVYGRSEYEYMRPKLYAIANETGGDININIASGCKFHANSVIDDEYPPSSNLSITEVGGIYCAGKVTITGDEDSFFSSYARSTWYVTENGSTGVASKPNLPTIGIRANGGLTVSGNVGGSITIQNKGVVTAGNDYCSSAIRVTSGAKVNLNATGDWIIGSSSCTGTTAIIYTPVGSVTPTVGAEAGKVEFNKGSNDNDYFVLNRDGECLTMSGLPEIDTHTLSLTSNFATYYRDSRNLIKTTTIELTEVPAIGTNGAITEDNTKLDVDLGISPRYTLSKGRWEYKTASLSWSTLGSNQLLPEDTTNIRAVFSLAAKDGYRLGYSTNVKVKLPNGQTRNTTETAYVYPRETPSRATYYIELELSDISEQHPIEEVKISYLQTPASYLKAWISTAYPFTTSSAGDIYNKYTAHYEWAVDQYSAAGYPGVQYWTEVDDDGTDTGTVVAADTKFTAGKKYRWHGILHAKTGWKFTYGTYRTINDGTALPAYVSDDGKLVEIARTWDCPTLAISKVEVVGQTEPVAGQTPTIDGTVPDEANYSIDSDASYWVEGNLDATTYWTDANTKFTGTFKANTWYTNIIYLDPDRDNGYAFAGSSGVIYSNNSSVNWSKANATINGTGYDYGYYFANGSTDGRGQLMILRTFFCQDADAIARVDIDTPLPVTGQRPGFYATTDTPDVTMEPIASEISWYAEFGIDTSVVPADATAVWMDSIFDENEDFNVNAFNFTFQNSSRYNFTAKIHAQNGLVFSRDGAGVANVKVFVGGTPATVSIDPNDDSIATVTMTYYTPVPGNGAYQLFVPTGVSLEYMTEEGVWSAWSPTVENISYTGFDLYNADEAAYFRIKTYWPSTWKAPSGDEFYKWYSPSSDVEFESSVRDQNNYFTMPAHDTTIDILTQKEGTLPARFTSWLINGYTTSDGWKNPESWNWTSYNAATQWREAVLVDDKGTSDTSDDYTLVAGTDYTVSYEPAKGADADSYTITYTGIPGPHNVGGYEGSFTTKYSIDKASLYDCDITLNTTHMDDPANPGDDPVYWEYYNNGEEITPSVTVKLGDYTLEEGKDYELKYYWNTGTGTAQVEIDAIGNMTGWTTKRFEIRAHDLSEATITPPADVVYNGSYQEPPVTVRYDGTILEQDTDFYAYYSNNWNAGEAKITLEGNQYYGWTGSREVTFQIKPLDLNSESIVWEPLSENWYDGGEREPYVCSASDSPINIAISDISCTFSDNVYPGEATVTVTPNNSNFTGSKTLHFDIIGRLDLSYIEYTGVEINYEPGYTYTGKPIEPKPTVTLKNDTYGDVVLKEGTDYTLNYTDSTSSSNWASVTVSAVDGSYYRFSEDISYYIHRANIANAKADPIPNQRYNEETYPTPMPTLTFNGTKLEVDTDYYVVFYGGSYPEVGDSFVRIAGAGNFKETVDIPFKITDKFVDEAVIAAVADQTYTGAAIDPKLSVTLKGEDLVAGTDYTVAYKNNTDVGTATATIIGAGEYAGEASVDFKIVPADIATASVASIAKQSYTGSEVTPNPELTFNGTALAKGTDYKLSYSNNVLPGKATVIIAGKGNFTGTTSTTFKIVVPNDQLADDGTPAGAGATAAAAEAAILTATSEEGPAGTEFSLLQAKASKVTKNSVTLKWKKVKGAKSYSIYGNACGKKNKYVKIKSLKKTTFTQKKLKKGTYYKYLIVAIDKSGKVISTSKTIHAATTGGKVGNYKQLKLSKKKATLKKGKKLTLKSTVVPKSKKLKVQQHRKVAWESSDPTIAKVNNKGKVTAKKKGKVTIWAYAQDGVCAKCTVTVK